jgi:hypothetical protein
MNFFFGNESALSLLESIVPKVAGRTYEEPVCMQNTEHFNWYRTTFLMQEHPYMKPIKRALAGSTNT